MNKLISLRWFKYHLGTFLDLIVVFHPFRRIGTKVPLVCIPNNLLSTFVFAMVSSLIIYVPVILFVANYANAGLIIPEFFIVTIFGVIFGTIFRSIQSNMVSVIQIDRHQLTLTHYGFYKKETTVIKRDQLKTMVLMKEKYRGTKNYKICVETSDGRHVMLKLTIFKKSAENILNTYRNALGLLVSNPSEKQIINDAHFTIH
ncbi:MULTISPECIES: hypothetical protein [unclassified Saccharicrinis]|uniref:hypothetical protein n=1 Tax=unclassified Saccharicrinis TaxID=2646859 RepID=UPI003D3324C4